MADVRKVVVLARGLGTRMRAAGGSGLTAEQQAAADAGHKALMPVGGRPLLDYSLSALADAGLTQVCLVIGPEHQAIRDYYAHLRTERLTIETATQAEPRGTADAVAAAATWVGEDRAVMVNGDNLYATDSVRALLAAPGCATLGYDAQALVARSNIPPERVARFALLDVDTNLHLTGIQEKPSADVVAARGPHALVSMNCFLLDSAALDAAGRVPLSPRGELEIGDALRLLVAEGHQVDVIPVQDGVLDLSSREDIAAVERALSGATVRL